MPCAPTKQEIKKRQLIDALARAKGNQSVAAEILGISPGNRLESHEALWHHLLRGKSNHPNRIARTPVLCPKRLGAISP